MGKEIVVKEATVPAKTGVNAMLPVECMEDLMALGQAVAQSGMFGACTNGKGAVIAACVLQEGMSFLDFKRTWHVTSQGDVTMRADRMLAEYFARGGKMQWVEFTTKRAAAKWTYRDHKDLLIEYTFSEAEQAGLVRKGSGWTKDPAAQLRARCISRAVRMLAPEVCAGVYTPEEMHDVQAEIIAQAEEARTAKPQEPIPSPFAPPPPKDAHVIQFDYFKCPMPGKMMGVPWSEMPVDTLKYALKTSHPDMEPEHYQAIQETLREMGVSDE